MQPSVRYFLRTAIGIAVYALTMHPGWALNLSPDSVAQSGDPARWYQEDTTAHARFSTLKKEAGAVYQEALVECKAAERAVRAACGREAHIAFELDMTEARRQTQMARP